MRGGKGRVSRYGASGPNVLAISGDGYVAVAGLGRIGTDMGAAPNVILPDTYVSLRLLDRAGVLSARDLLRLKTEILKGTERYLLFERKRVAEAAMEAAGLPYDPEEFVGAFLPDEKRAGPDRRAAMEEALANSAGPVLRFQYMPRTGLLVPSALHLAGAIARVSEQEGYEPLVLVATPTGAAVNAVSEEGFYAHGDSGTGGVFKGPYVKTGRGVLARADCSPTAVCVAKKELEYLKHEDGQVGAAQALTIAALAVNEGLEPVDPATHVAAIVPAAVGTGDFLDLHYLKGLEIESYR